MYTFLVHERNENCDGYKLFSTRDLAERYVVDRANEESVDDEHQEDEFAYRQFNEADEYLNDCDIQMTIERLQVPLYALNDISI